MKRLITFILMAGITIAVNAQTAPDCKPVWEEASWGADIGERGILSSDLDGDGYSEIVAVSEMGLYWFVIKYDTLSGDYKKTWISEYTEKGIYYPDFLNIWILDCDQDSEPEIIVSLNDRIEIRNGRTYEIENVIDYCPRAYNFLMADADNDGSIEIIVQYSDTTTLLIPGTYQIKLSLNNTAQLKCGNVDGDGFNELVFKDHVAIIMPGDTIPATKWTYNTNEDHNFYLSDIDHDGIEEILRTNDSLKVYDGENLKYADSTGYWSSILLIEDLDGDGNKEILVNQLFSKRLLCFNGEDGTLLWSRDSTISEWYSAFADTDNDGYPEIILSISEDNKGSFLRVMDPLTMEDKWRSNGSSSPLFVKAGNMDADADDELIMIASDRSAWNYATRVTILNAVTKETEYTNDEPIANATLTGIELYDIDGDAIPETVLCGETSNRRGVITILSGTDHLVMGTHVFEDLPSFQSIRIADITRDGEPEFVVRSDSNVLLINLYDYTVFKQYQMQGKTSLYDLWVGNVDDDEDLEIVTIEAGIHIIDYQTDTTVVSIEKTITSIALLDIDNDGIQEIFGGTMFSGKIGVYKGQTRLRWLPVQEGKRINSIAAVAGGDGKILVVYECDGMVKFINMDGELLATHDMFVSNLMGSIEAFDYNHDGMFEIFATNEHEINEFSIDFIPCFYFDGNIEISGEHCMKADGSVSINLVSGEPPYSYLWSTGDTISSVSGLTAGNYSVTATDSQGCIIQYEAIVPELYPVTAIPYKSADLAETSACEGMALIEVSHSAPPIFYSIDGSAPAELNDTIKGLCEGVHELVITDNFGCTQSYYLVIEGLVGLEDMDGRACRVFPIPASDIVCIEFPEPLNGTATIYSVSGTPLKSFPLSGLKTEIPLNSLKNGAYWLRIITNNNNLLTRKLIVTK